jgi:hypothetical protein
MAKGGFDYSQFRKLVKNMESVQREFDQFLKDFLLKQALIALRLVKPRTPVDTGHLRNSWELTDVQIFDSYLIVSLVNPVEYASFMENGFVYHTKEGDKRYPGHHMAELSILQVQQQMPAKFDRAFKNWLKSKGWG